MQPLIVSHFRLMSATSVLHLWLLIFCTAAAAQTIEPEGRTESSSDYCSRTSDLRLSHRLRREAIKHEILLRLGLDEPPPNPDPSFELPTNDPVFLENYLAAQEVQKVYNANQKPCTKLDTNEKKLIAFFPFNVTGHLPVTHPTHAQQNQKDQGGKDSGPQVFNKYYRLKFMIDLVDVTTITNVIDYLQAELRLLKLPQFQVIENRRDQGTMEDRVEIRLIERPKDNLGQELPIFITYELLKPENGYAVFNISKAITEWIKRRDSLAGEMELDVLIRHPETSQYGSTFEPIVQFSQNKQTIQLVLTVYNEEEVAKRAAITATFSTNNPSRCEFQCCWHSLSVNFRRDYNWTWITPETVEFNYCSGECPMNWAVDGEHVRLLNIHRRRVLEENPTAAPEPCCVPDSYREEMFILNLKNKTEVLWVDDAIVTSCVCR